MTSTPIADAAERSQDQNQNGSGVSSFPNHARGDAGYQYAPPATDFMGDLIDAQQQYIASQHKFLKDGNITALVIAQTELVNAQGFVIARLLAGPST